MTNKKADNKLQELKEKQAERLPFRYLLHSGWQGLCNNKTMIVEAEIGSSEANVHHFGSSCSIKAGDASKPSYVRANVDLAEFGWVSKDRMVRVNSDGLPSDGGVEPLPELKAAWHPPKKPSFTSKL